VDSEAMQPDAFPDKTGAERRSKYQRRAFDRTGGHGDRHRGRRSQRVQQAPPVNAGWFQRPYPYHLDYYRMRYGGSYAPYFGNLYGPPQVVTAPPYYGPYYGGYAYPIGPEFNGGYGQWTPSPRVTNGIVHEGQMPGGEPIEDSAGTSSDGTLPPPQ
jgi:hypothetical protein